MTLLKYFIYEYGPDEFCPITQLPSRCPKEYGYAADPEWCSYGANRDDCCRCWGREAKDPFIAAQLPNYTPVDDRKGYCDLGGFRLVIEEGCAVGVYAPDVLEEDLATVVYSESFVGAICRAADKLGMELQFALETLLRLVGIVPDDAEDAH